MAGGGNNDDMNPFIAYVDLFSSVILVLLLFVLIMFVNIGYYMQFNSKDRSSNETNTTEQQEENVTEVVQVKKEDYEKLIQVFQQHETNNTTPVRGGEAEGNVISKKSEKFATADFVDNDTVIAFKNNEYFLTKDIVQEVASFMENRLKKDPNAIFYLSVGDSTKLISSTQTKQVSLGRILSLKNSLQAMPGLQNKIKISYKQSDASNYQYGYIKIDVK